MRIEVKKSHIKKGTPESPQRCPIALAIKAVTKHEFSVLPGDIIDEVSGEEYDMPSNVYRFVEMFDSEERGYRKKCKPFAFTLKKRKAA